MNKEGLGGNSGDQGPMDLWGRLAAVSNNYGMVSNGLVGLKLMGICKMVMRRRGSKE